MIWARRYVCAACQTLLGKLSGYSLVEGVPVANVLRTGEESEQFIRCCAEALTLVRESSGIRYRRIVRYVKKIHNGDDHHIASFNWPSKICTINFPRLLNEHPDTVETLAAILVHESIHGLLWQRGIATTRQNFQDIEGVCDREELRFWKWLEQRRNPNALVSQCPL